MRLLLPYPPTVNHYWCIWRGRAVISKAGREYRKAVAVIVASTVGTPRLPGRLDVHIRVWTPDRRRRDIDNLLKSTLDSLQAAEVYLDDEQIDDVRITRMGVEKPGRAEVEVRELDRLVDALTAYEERPVTETEPGIGEVVYAPFGPRPVWRAAFKTCERWYWCTFDDQARFAYPLDEPPRTYRPILPAPKEAK